MPIPSVAGRRLTPLRSALSSARSHPARRPPVAGWFSYHIVAGADNSAGRVRHRSGHKAGNRYLKLAFSHATVRARLGPSTRFANFPNSSGIVAACSSAQRRRPLHVAFHLKARQAAQAVGCLCPVKDGRRVQNCVCMALSSVKYDMALCVQRVVPLALVFSTNGNMAFCRSGSVNSPGPVRANPYPKSGFPACLLRPFAKR